MRTKIIISAVDNLTRPLKRMNKSTRKLSSSMSGLKTAVAGLGLGLIAKQALQTGMAFQETLADLSAITGATGKNLDFIKNKAIEFSKTTIVSAQGAVEAFKLVASAKPDLLNNAAALSEVTRQAIILSEASGSTLAEAAKTVGSSLNQFGAGAKQAGRFINVLAAGAKFGASEIGDTAQALKTAGTVARMAGLSFEDTNAAIQAMAAVSLKGSEAGTGLRGVLLKLENQTSKRFKPSVVGFSKALLNLRDAHLSTRDKTKLFGLESITAANALLAQADSLGQLTKKITGSNTAYEQAHIKTNTLTTDVKRLNHAFQNLGISSESAGNIGLRAVTQGLTQILQDMDGVGSGADSLSLQIAKGADVLGNFAKGIALPFEAAFDAIVSFSASLSFLFEGEFKKALNVRQQGENKIAKLFNDATMPATASRFENKYRSLLAEKTGAPVDQGKAPGHTGAPAQVGGTLHIKIDSDGKARVNRLEKHGGMDINVDTGPIPVGAG